ncbi:MAG TPA: PilN domain-containing protein [Gemmatimonadaceae bacterium]|nr:PilN domain-containing protein [Gemmatimonadaceae bacterium]
MSSCVGVELDAHAIRGVRLDGWRRRRPTRVLEVAWDPDSPAEGVRMLRDSLGRARRVAVAIRLPLLFAQRVTLPPMPRAERRTMMRLEPQRFFPIRLDDVVVALGREDLVFAGREAPIVAWARALEDLGPVDVIEPGPIALARALGAAGVSDCLAVLDDADHGVGVIDIRDGGVESARRMYRSVADAAPALDATTRTIYVAPWDEVRARALATQLPGHSVEPLAGCGDVPPVFLSAYGAALGVGADLDGMLLSDELDAGIVGRRRRRMGVAGLVCAASIIVALLSADAWRERAARDIDVSLASIEQRAAPVLALQDALASRQRRAAAIAQIEAERPDPLRVLLALSTRLPKGAHLRSMGLSGANWQIDGYAPQAAEVTQSLGAATEFREVHVLAATNRARIGTQTYESFSVAFRFVPSP